MSVTVDMNILITYSLAILVFIHSYKFRGAFKSLLLLFGAVIIGGGIENVNSILGGYHYPGSSFTIFLADCPIDIILGWYMLIYSCSFSSHILIGRGKYSLPTQGLGTAPEQGINKEFIKLTLLRAALAAALAVNLDMFIDPVAVENGWWIWTITNIYIQGVPLGNYIGWFLLIFTTIVFYELIITYAEVHEQKQKVTAAYWSVGTIVASFLAGGVNGLIAIFLGTEGIRTEIPGKLPVDLAITPDRVLPVITALLVVFVALYLIMLSSLVPNEAQAPKGKIWWTLPSIMLLIFWVMIIVVAFMTSFEMIIIGFTQPMFIVGVSIYLIVKPYSE